MVPLIIVNVLGLKALKPKSLELVLLGVYVVQYSVNCFVYAARYKEYRKAYIFFLREIWHKITCQKLRPYPELEITSRITRQT